MTVDSELAVNVRNAHSNTGAEVTDRSGGYVEFMSYRSDMEALFIGGWIEPAAAAKTFSKVTAEFQQVQLTEHVNTFLYERSDIADGIGFVLFFKWTGSLPEDMCAVQFDYGNGTRRIRPTLDFLILPEGQLAGHLNHIAQFVKDKEHLDELQTVLVGRGFVDYAFRYDGIVAVEGWIFGFSNKITIRHDAETIDDDGVLVFNRPDVSEVFTNRGARAIGFVLMLDERRISGPLTFDFGMTESVLTVDIPDGQATVKQIDQFVRRHTKRAGFLLRRSKMSPRWARAIVGTIDRAPADFNEAMAHIEQSRGVNELGGLVVGWAVSLLPWKLFVISAEGTVRPLAHASRWNRGDVVEVHEREFGSFSLNAGFLVGIIGPIIVGTDIRVIAVRNDIAYGLSEAIWAAAPVDPVSYARWAFDFPVPSVQLARRFEIHDYRILSTLQQRKNLSVKESPISVRTFGAQVENPVCSIVIPLYGRFDFMQHQMLEFAEDKTVSENSEIIYVVDDPKIIGEVKEFSELMIRAVEIPFKLVISEVNRGFAGATNVGVRASKSSNVLFLNSDVIPQSSGWLDKLISALDSSLGVGIVGARLLYANGCLQHDGMTFRWDPNWGAYLNKHPGSGLRPPLAVAEHVRRPAVTAACALLSRDTFELVGGLDEGFLIGDFEDSDLCLKIRGRGLDVVCVQEVNLVHLERQSFSGIGTGRFRECVARYNAYVHNSKWADSIRALLNLEGGFLQ